MADIDNLQIRIQADAEDASKKLDKLANSMLNLASSMSINVGKMSGIAIGLRSISSSSANLNSRNISTLATSLNKLAKVDTNGIYNTASAFRTLSSSFSGISTVDVSGISNAATAIAKLGGVKATQGTSNLILMKDQLAQFIQGLNSVGPLTFDATGLANTISAIAKLGGKTATQATANLPSLSAQLQNFVRQMNQIGSMTFDTTNLANLVTAISRLGSVASGRAVTNIPLLASNLKKLFQTLSTAPNVSQNIIDMTNAIANLARTGSSAGTAARSLSGGLNVFSTSAGKAQKKAFSLAAAFGKFYATYFLVIRAVRALAGAVNISSSLTEVENVVSTTFGNMEYKINDFVQNSIQQFGMSELSVKQYASTFQAMGTAMGIGGRQIEKANSFLNGATNGYVGLSDSLADVSLNMTKLTADIASFYDKDQADVAKDLQAVYTGMVVPLRKYGLDLTKATLKEWAMKNGLDSNIESMTQAEKTMLRYQYVMANTVAAQGDFARTSDTWANQIRILKQSFQQLAGIIGGILINALKPFVKALNTTLQYVISFAQTVSESLGKIFGWKYEQKGGGIASDFEDAADATGDIASGLEDAEKASKKLKNNIYAFDQINKASSSSSGTGTSGSGSSGLAGTGSNLGGQWSKGDSILDGYESQLDTLFKLGRHISDTLSKAMEDIDWDSIYEKARNFGSGLAEFLNGLITPRLFGNVGTTIAGALNTAIEWAFGFGTTFEFKNLGLSIAEGINNFFKTFDFAKFAQTLNTWVNGLLETILTAITHINWAQIGYKIIQFIGNLEPQTVLTLIGFFGFKKFIKPKMKDFGLEIAGYFLNGAKGLLGSPSASLVFQNPVAAAASGIETKVNPILATIGGIGAALGGAGLAVGSFVDIWQNGYSIMKEILLGLGIGIAGVGAVLLGAPATVAAVVAGIIFTAANLVLAIHENWDSIKEKFSQASEWIGNVFTTDWGKKIGGIGEIFNAFLKNISNIWDSIKETFNGITRFVSGAFSGDWEKAWNGVKDIFKGIWDTMKSIVRTPVNTIIGACNALISAAERSINNVIKLLNKLSFDVPDWVPELGGKHFGLNMKSITVPRIPLYRVGGFPEDGLFFANHNEMVGRFSNGKTAVANNDQIIEGIKQGVTEAMMQVLMAANSNSGSGDTSIEIPLYIGNEEIARATSKGISSLKRRGVILPEFA